MKIYYSDAHRQHNPPFEIFDGGEKVPSFEVPDRAERILTALKQTAWAKIVPPKEFGLAPILAVHDADYVDFLQTAFDEWTREATGYQPTVLLPATFPPGRWRHKPKALLGRTGYYMSDLSVPILAGTYPAARMAVNCALSGAQAVAKGDRAAFALCRPPGHHAGKAHCGGYCYFNNAAIAANGLSKRGKVALLDIDYHAGNGTQEIFYERADVLTISIHADPSFEYPYFCGYADELGADSGTGFNHNFPLPAGAEISSYLQVLHEALDLIQSFEATSLVLSAGMDLLHGDPLGKFKIRRDGIDQIGREIANLALPTLIVMEGGYNSPSLGQSVATLLEAFI